MGYSPKYQRLALTIGTDEDERKVQTSFRLSESIVASLNSIASAISVSKTEVLNQVLEIGLSEFCEALQGNRPDLAIDMEEAPSRRFEFNSPGEIRMMRERLGDAFQLDLDDAIKQAESQKIEEEEE